MWNYLKLKYSEINKWVTHIVLNNIQHAMLFINYVYRTPKTYNSGFTGYLGFINICEICGIKKSTVACDCRWYYDVQILTKEEFEKAYNKKLQKSEENMKIDDEYEKAKNMTVLLNI